MDETKLRAIASRQLNMVAATVPKSYLNELYKHSQVFANDQEFIVTLQPGAGYGIITCLERDCYGMKIKLNKRDGGDGGLKHGFGSFLEYQKHIRSHEGHNQSRLDRLQGVSKATSRHVTQQPVTNFTQPRARANGSSLLKTLDRIGSSPIMSSPVPSPSQRVPSTSSVPRKRATDTFEELVDGVKSEEIDTKPSFPAPSKRPRVSMPSRPLTPSNAVAQSYSQFIPSPYAEQLKPYEDSVKAFDDWISKAEAEIRALKKSKKRTGSLSATRQSQLTRANTVLNSYTLAKTRAEDTLRQAREQILKILAAANVPVRAEEQKPRIIKAEDGSSPLKIKSRRGVGSIQPPPESSQTASSSQPRRSLPGSDDMSSIIHRLSQYGGVQSDSDTDDEDDYPSILHRRRAPRPNAPLSLDEFLMRMTGTDFDHNSTVESGLKKLALADINTRLPGMAIRLLPHQILGVAWMLDREGHSDQGGILADEMGLGNIQTLALMTKNESDDPAVKTTLIVAPLALLAQWKGEIENRTDGGYRVLIYHGPNKPTTKRQLQKYDVILTTYHTLGNEYPNYDKIYKEKERKIKRKGDDFVVSDSDDDKPKKKQGLLMKFSWYRVVLDEAQTIRNKGTHISIAVENLTSEYRWCLSGTPITNSLGDAYPLLRFLRIRPWNDWDTFRAEISSMERSEAETASAKLQAIFRLVMLRRKKDSMLDGRPLVQLPPRTQYDDVLSFPLEERSIYDFVAARAQAVFNRFLREGTVLKNYAHVFVMLLRLRQICVHPCLIEEKADAFRTEEEILGVRKREELNEVIGRARREMGQYFVDKMLAKLQAEMDARVAAEKESADANIEGETCPVCFEPLDNDALVTQCCHAICDECLTKVLDGPQHDDADEKVKMKAHQRPCPSCRGPISRQHSYLRAAFEPHDPMAKKETEDAIFSPIPSRSSSSKLKEEPMDREAVSPGPKLAGKRQSLGRQTKRLRPAVFLTDESDNDSEDSMEDFIVPDEEDDEETDARMAKKPTKPKRERPSHEEKYKARFSEAEEDEDAERDDKFVQSLPDFDDSILRQRAPKSLASFLPSTKMKAMMDLLKKWKQEAPGDKVMIISQWTSALDLCSSYLNEHEFNHVIFQGSMSARQRNEAVHTFMTDPDVTVLLMSLKAGGVGLNLTEANRVISLDPAWSTAVENQAFDRVHRLGQQKPVSIHRLIVANTVEQRVLDLQKTKQDLADGSLGEGTIGKRNGRYSVRQLAGLFGLNARGQVIPPAPEPLV